MHRGYALAQMQHRKEHQRARGPHRLGWSPWTSPAAARCAPPCGRTRAKAPIPAPRSTLRTHDHHLRCLAGSWACGDEPRQRRCSLRPCCARRWARAIRRRPGEAVPQISSALGASPGLQPSGLEQSGPCSAPRAPCSTTLAAKSACDNTQSGRCASELPRRCRRLLGCRLLGWCRPPAPGQPTPHCLNSHRWYITDDRGVVCPRDTFDYATGCCTTGELHSCASCADDDKCCAQYEHCVSCCLRPENKPEAAMQGVYRGRNKCAPGWAVAAAAATRPDGGRWAEPRPAAGDARPAPPAPTHRPPPAHALSVLPCRPETGKWDTPFQYCRAACRTTARSTQHENAFIADRKHCFSKVRAVEARAVLGVVSSDVSGGWAARERAHCGPQALLLQGARAPQPLLLGAVAAACRGCCLLLLLRAAALSVRRRQGGCAGCKRHACARGTGPVCLAMA